MILILIPYLIAYFLSVINPIPVDPDTKFVFKQLPANVVSMYEPHVLLIEYGVVVKTKQSVRRSLVAMILKKFTQADE